VPEADIENDKVPDGVLDKLNDAVCERDVVLDTEVETEPD
jgi:hypothetical protein